MSVLTRLGEVLDHPGLYRLWQAPFAAMKFACILRHNDLSGVRSVLDVGCGPGTNCSYFEHAEYVGLDQNARYIEYARRRYRRRFDRADVRCDALPDGTRFDFVLLNSLLHHCDDREVRQILRRLRESLADEAHIHIIDLVLPPRAGMAHFLARSDRGRYARTREEWSALFRECYEPVVFEPHHVRLWGLTLWELIYFKGTRKG